jgi:lipopolysaccharide export system protein LptA
MKPFHWEVLKGRFIVGAVCAGFAFTMLLAGDASAQNTVTGVPNAMQGFSQNRDQPIQIDAASL